MARLSYGSQIMPSAYSYYQPIGYLGASCTDAIASYGNNHYGWMYSMTNHNHGAYVRTWGFGRGSNYEGMIVGDIGGSGVYVAGFASSGGTISISTHSAAGAYHYCTYHGLNATLTADAAYPFTT